MPEPLSIFDSRGVEICELLPARPFPPPPADLDARLKSDWPRELGARFRFTLKDATVVSHHGEVLDARGRLLTDHAPRFRQTPWKKPAEPAFLPGHSLLVTAPSAWKNYSHWLLSAFVKTRLASERGYQQILAPLARPFHRETLSLLPGQALIELGQDSCIRCESLDVVTSLPPGHLHPEEVNWLKTTLARNNPCEPRRLYLSRGGAWRRRVLNEEEILPLITAQGFWPISLGELTASEQAGTVAHAEALLAPHGAALANLVYAEKHCRVTEVFPENYLRPNFCHLSRLLGLDYRAFIVPNPPDAPDFTIPPELLQRILKS